MSIAALVETLLSAGVDHATVIAAVKAVEDASGVDEQAERRRAADRERKRAAILRNSAESAEKRNLVSPLTPPLEGFPKPLPKSPPIIPPSNNTPARENPASAFAGILKPETAKAVVAHRKAKKAPLTLRSAELLAKAFAETGEPEAAAEMMILQGWQGFKPEWFANARAGPDRRQRGQPSSANDYLSAELRKYANASSNDDFDGITIDASPG